MSIQGYIEQQKDIQKTLLEFIEQESNDKSNYDNLIKKFDNPSIRKDRCELSNILRLIANVSNHHHRSPNFLSKIEQVLLLFKDDIKQILSNLQIFDIFRKNKQVLLFLIKEKILIPDQSIIEKISNENYKQKLYLCFFFPELQSLLDEKLIKEVQPKINDIDKQLFEQLRQNGENNSQYCQLIRNDSIDEFISYTKEHKLPLTTSIEPSVFETNPFLLKRIPTLIEYSAFYGSLKILNYLLQNNIRLTGSVWLYAIHSQKMEIIHLLEDKKVQPNDPSYLECFIEAIKCHHIEIADYIKSNLYKDQNENLRVNSQAIASRNYYYFPQVLRRPNEFYDLCKYNYYKIVDFLLTNVADIDCNARVISIFLFLYPRLQLAYHI